MNRANGILSPLFHLTALCSITLCAIASVAVCNAGDLEKPPDAGRRKIIWGDPISVYRKPPLEVFGERELPPVNSGFLFVDGEYLDLPYRITQRGQCVYVNGRRILKYMWPPTVFCVHREMPKIPPDAYHGAKRIFQVRINEKTIAYYGFDKDFGIPSTFTDVLLSWCCFFYRPRYAMRVYAEAVRKMPFVQSVDVLKPPTVGIRVVYKDGFTMTYEIPAPDNSPERKICGHTAILKHVSEAVHNLRKELEAGKCVFWDSHARNYRYPENVITHLGARVGGIPREKIPEMISNILRILESKDSLEKKGNRLAWDLHVFDRDRSFNAKAFCASFHVDEEFQQRLKTLEKELGRTGKPE